MWACHNKNRIKQTQRTSACNFDWTLDEQGTWACSRHSGQVLNNLSASPLIRPGGIRRDLFQAKEKRPHLRLNQGRMLVHVLTAGCLARRSFVRIDSGSPCARRLVEFEVLA